MSTKEARLENWMSKPPVRLGFNAALLLGWAWLFRAVFPYLGTIFTQQEFRTNQIVLLGALLLIGIQVRKGAWRLELAAQPQFYRPAMALLLGSAAAFMLVERFVDINTLSASLCGLAAYALLGLYTSPRRWRQGLPAALLLIGALPFGEHMQTFIGYPVRILTAGVVRAGLEAAGVTVGSTETILVFESGLTQVDLPCSGVKSLWTGGLFFLAATWIEGRAITRRWFLAALAFAAILLAANLGRVAVLVVVGQVLDWRLLAEMLHVPLGVLGFILACAAGLGLLRWASPAAALPEPAQQPAQPRPAWLAPLLAISLLLLGLFYTPRPQPAAAQALPRWQFTPGLALTAWDFTPQELDWLLQDGADSVQRWRFVWQRPERLAAAIERPILARPTPPRTLFPGIRSDHRKFLCPSCKFRISCPIRLSG